MREVVRGSVCTIDYETALQLRAVVVELAALKDVIKLETLRTSKRFTM